MFSLSQSYKIDSVMRETFAILVLLDMSASIRMIDAFWKAAEDVMHDAEEEGWGKCACGGRLAFFGRFCGIPHFRQ